jgi:uncharacterized protein
LGISGIITNEYSWQQKGNNNEKGAQIDFIIDRSDNCINILEIKFYNASYEVSKKYAEELREKVHIFKTKNRIRKNIFVTLLTAYGAKKNPYYLSEVTNDLIVDDLFE